MSSLSRRARRTLLALVVVAAVASTIAYANVGLLRLEADTSDPLGSLKAAVPERAHPPASRAPSSPLSRPERHPAPQNNGPPLEPTGRDSENLTSVASVRSSAAIGIGKGARLAGDEAAGTRLSPTKPEGQAPEGDVPDTVPAPPATGPSASQPGPSQPASDESEHEPEPDE